jgi:hypothetical protein
MEDLRDAIDFMKKALAGKPGGLGYPSLRTQLGNFYKQRYQCTHDRKDLDTAIAYAAEGVEALPEDHWDRARRSTTSHISSNRNGWPAAKPSTCKQQPTRTRKDSWPKLHHPLAVSSAARMALICCMKPARQDPPCISSKAT